jgi:hypothetical protein
MASDRIVGEFAHNPFTDIDGSELEQILARLNAENAEFELVVDRYVATLISHMACSDEPPKLIAVQRKMLVHMLKSHGPEYLTPLADLADAIGERNRKLVREAGRALGKKGALIITSEPSDGAEGLRVVGYNFTEEVEAGFDAVLAALEQTLEAEVADAVKQ